MKSWLLVLSLSAGAAGSISAQAADSSRAAAHPPARDALFGLDKPKHLVLSAFVESVSFAGLEAAGASPHGAMAGAVSLTALVGVGREIHDRRTKGLFSFGDLVWDALGAGAASYMLRHTYR